MFKLAVNIVSKRGMIVGSLSLEEKRKGIGETVLSVGYLDYGTLALKMPDFGEEMSL